MSGETRQSLLFGPAGVAVVLRWLFVTYLPLRTAEGVTMPAEDSKERD